LLPTQEIEQEAWRSQATWVWFGPFFHCLKSSEYCLVMGNNCWDWGKGSFFNHETCLVTAGCLLVFSFPSQPPVDGTGVKMGRVIFPCLPVWSWHQGCSWVSL
jgi:hypothetical protein